MSSLGKLTDIKRCVLSRFFVQANQHDPTNTFLHLFNCNSIKSDDWAKITKGKVLEPELHPPLDNSVLQLLWQQGLVGGECRRLVTQWRNPLRSTHGASDIATVPLSAYQMDGIKSEALIKSHK
jgi:hypothetical protein